MHILPRCSECEFLKVYDYIHKCYYCDHDNRTDDMGKLPEYKLNIEIPEWCPLR